MAVPYTFGTASGSIPLSQLDSNFATGITIGNTTVQLGNTVTTLNNMTFANVTISSVGAALTPAQGGTGLTSLTANSVILGNGTSNVQVIAPGTSGNVLVSNGTTWSSGSSMTGPAFSAYLSGTQSLTTSTWTKAQANTKEYDTNTNYSTTNYRFTPTVAGYYQVDAAAVFTGTSTGGVTAIYKNGSLYKYGQTGASNSNVSALVQMNGSTDYIELWVQADGASPQVFAPKEYTYFQAFLARNA